MSWQRIKLAYGLLQQARDAKGDLTEAWQEFRLSVSDFPVPYHLKSLFQHLEAIRETKPAEKIRILDHGCGGALKLLCLAARGYTGGFGVDIGGTCERWNLLFSQQLQASEQRFFVYDGGTLPFQDSHFDIVFSQEVIEHVRPSVLRDYYAEERRVMKPNAVALHRVPHRLVPYDSHLRTWFLHYFPRPMWLAGLRLFGRDLTTAKEAIFLLWPWVHRQYARRYIGPTRDISVERFLGVTDLTHYEGSKGIRKLAGWIAKAPVLGIFTRSMLANVVMMDTVSIKRPVDEVP